jgi:hypothetical protein
LYKDAKELLSLKSINLRQLGGDGGPEYDGQFVDFSFPFISSDNKAVSIAAKLQASEIRIKKSISISIEPFEPVDRAPKIAGSNKLDAARPETPVKSPPREPKRRTLAVFIKNILSVCNSNRCPVKVDGNQVTQQDIGMEKEVGDSVKIEILGDWVFTSDSYLQAVGAGNRPRLDDAADRQSVILKEEVKGVDKYELELGLQKKKKRIRSHSSPHFLK